MAEMTYTNRKLLFVALFLSKYGKKAITELGFSTGQRLTIHWHLPLAANPLP